jgi:hypothetical protein
MSSFARAKDRPALVIAMINSRSNSTGTANIQKIIHGTIGVCQGFKSILAPSCQINLQTSPKISFRVLCMGLLAQDHAKRMSTKGGPQWPSLVHVGPLSKLSEKHENQKILNLLDKNLGIVIASRRFYLKFAFSIRPLILR